MLPAAFFVPVIHEWVKALVSTAQGDPAPRRHGFLTLNPFRYFEPLGFMLMMMFGFGWGQPVPTTALHYRDRGRGILLTYMIPVLVNLLLGIGAVIGVRIMANGVHWPMPGTAGIVWPGHYSLFFHLLSPIRWLADPYFLTMVLLANFGFISINFAIFNLIPVYPLAANKLLVTFSSPDSIARFNHHEKPMQILVFLGLAFGLIPAVIAPISRIVIRIAWGLI